MALNSEFMSIDSLVGPHRSGPSCILTIPGRCRNTRLKNLLVEVRLLCGDAMNIQLLDRTY